MKVTFYKNAKDANKRNNGIVIVGKNKDEVLEKANREVADKLNNFYGWAYEGELVGGEHVPAMFGVWD